MSLGPIFISAGEASGDAVGAALLTELRKLGYDGRVLAVGGKKLTEADAELVADSTGWGVIGILQALNVAPKIAREWGKVKAAIEREKPSLVIPIDFGYYNVRLCRVAKETGSKVLYFMPPGSWRRENQGKDLPQITDKIATPFEWSAKLLCEAGANAEWVGHPVLQLAGDLQEGQRDLFAILPGSRTHEIRMNLPLIAKAANLLQLDSLTPTIVAAPTADREWLKEEWSKYSKLEVHISSAGSFDVLKRARAAIICSGSATLEAAVCGCPMAVVYQATPAMKLQWYAVRKKIKYIALPSILLDRSAVPEMVNENGTPEKIAAVVQRLIDDTPERAAQVSDFEEIRRILGPNDAITRTAKIALAMQAVT